MEPLFVRCELNDFDRAKPFRCIWRRIAQRRQPTKPCLHPLLAVLSEVRLVAGCWLRPGNSSFANNGVSFFLDLWDHLPTHRRLRVVRADSGFCVCALLRLWAQLRLKFIVVARLSRPLQRVIGKQTQWVATEVEGAEVAEVNYHEADRPADTRMILIRHRLKDKSGRAGGKLLFDFPGYLYQALATNLPRAVKPLAVWREYNGRAACEGVIKELDAGYGLPQLACQQNRFGPPRRRSPLGDWRTIWWCCSSASWAGWRQSPWAACATGCL